MNERRPTAVVTTIQNRTFPVPNSARFIPNIEVMKERGIKKNARW